MPPNTQATEQEMHSLSFIDHFWSKDKTGMNHLFDYIQSTHQDLKVISDVYMERARIEQEFGEKLMLLAEKNHCQDKKEKDGILGAYSAVYTELQKTAKSHLELSDNLKNQVASELNQKLEEYTSLLNKWISSMHDFYEERRETMLELLKTRADYLKEYEMSNGQTTPMMNTLKEQYKVLVTKVDTVAQEWNSTWKEACEVMEAMEEDRIELLKSNVWEYANLTSATLLVQDEWCEHIRAQLEKCHLEQEIERCISLCGTGSKIPTTNDYVGELMREQKKKQHSSKPIPKPPVKPIRHSQENTPEQPAPKPQKEEKESSKEPASSEESPNMNTHDTLHRVPHHISDNMGSTATRGQIRRKPLNKALMEQVSNEMAIARQQRQEQSPATLEKSQSHGSLDGLLKTFEAASPTKPKSTESKPSHPNAVVSEEARARRQPSEYKPDTGSIPTRKNKQATPNHVLQEISTERQELPLTHPVVVPKSPRPSAQQIPPEEAHHTPMIQPYHGYNQPPMMASPMIHRSPMMQPSPIMQPIASPLIQSPMINPVQHFGTSSRGTLPPPITIPTSVSPQVSPAMSYANLGGVSPGGVLPSPAMSSPYVQQAMPRPHQYSDGRPIQFWARAKYDYQAKEADELCFKAHQCIGILEADITQQSWWFGAVWDDYRHIWSAPGSVPSNFMEIIQ